MRTGMGNNGLLPVPYPGKTPGFGAVMQASRYSPPTPHGKTCGGTGLIMMYPGKSDKKRGPALICGQVLNIIFVICCFSSRDYQ